MIRFLARVRRRVRKAQHYAKNGAMTQFLRDISGLDMGGRGGFKALGR